MFTGIIDHCGEIMAIDLSSPTLRMKVACNFTELEVGESIAVDGICLTVVDPTAEGFSCDISPETSQITTAQYFKQGRLVNVERAMQLSSRMGGHFVQGHVDNMAYLAAREELADCVCLTFKGLAAADMAYVIKKGSISINGISLTINETLTDGLQVMIIPHTLARTNLQTLNVGDYVNIEFDYLAKIVAHQLKSADIK